MMEAIRQGYAVGSPKMSVAPLGGLVTPDTILRWCRKLMANKYDGTARRGEGDPAPPLRCNAWSFVRHREPDLGTPGSAAATPR